VSIRKLFKILESNFNHTKSGKGKIQYSEKANAALSSPNFVDPAGNAASEQARLEGKPLAEPSDLYY